VGCNRKNEGEGDVEACDEKQCYNLEKWCINNIALQNRKFLSVRRENKNDR